MREDRADDTLREVGPGVVLSALVVASFRIDEVPDAVAWAALVGGLLAALGAFLGSRGLANLHWGRRDCLEGLEIKLKVCLAEQREPSRDELYAFADEFRDCTSGAASRSRTPE